MENCVFFFFSYYYEQASKPSQCLCLAYLLLPGPGVVAAALGLQTLQRLQRAGRDSAVGCLQHVEPAHKRRKTSVVSNCQLPQGVGCCCRQKNKERRVPSRRAYRGQSASPPRGWCPPLVSQAFRFLATTIHQL